MKIIYGRKTDGKDVNRMDAIVMNKSELKSVAQGGIVAFRGDDRKPVDIFVQGFKARSNNYPIDCTYIVENPKTWDDVINDYAKQHSGVAQDGKFRRDKQYRVSEDEICFRPNHLDLIQDTCVSLTLEPLLALGFPLNQKVKITYLYAVKLTGPYLPTYEVQCDGGNAILGSSKELTALEVSPENVIGAAVVHRTVTGTDSMSTVEYEITLWEANPRHPGNASIKRGTTIDQTIFNYTGYKLVPLKGSKKVAAGMKAAGNTASNAVLVRAVKAICLHTKIQKLSGTPPKDEGLSRELKALLD